MVKNTDLLNIGYYDYGRAFSGSYKGIRYRIAREPLEKVVYIPKEQRGEAVLRLSIWNEPYSYDNTKDDIHIKDFEYSNTGLERITDYINNYKIES